MSLSINHFNKPPVLYPGHRAGFLMPGDNMAAGTIVLTNNSTAVTGTGTAFKTDLVANDFIVAVVGGVTYTLGIKSIESDAALTLNTAYTGPTASGAAWSAVANQTLVGITAQIAADTARAIRGLNLDKANWQQVYSGTGTITVKLPDGSTYTGPAWNSITTSLAGKLDKSGGALTGSLTVPGIEISSATPFVDFHYGSTTDDYNVRLINDASGYLTFFGTALRMNGSRLMLSPDGNTSMRYVLAGTIRYTVMDNTVFYASSGYRTAQGSTGAAGSNAYNYFWTGSQLEAYIDSSRVGIVTLSSTSDKQLKKDISYREDAADALAQVLQWRPADFKMKKRGIIPETADQMGFIANDLAKVSPECVSGAGLPDDYDIEADPNNPDAYYLNQVPMIARLAQAIQAQQKIIDSQNTVIGELQKRMKALDGLDA